MRINQALLTVLLSAFFTCAFSQEKAENEKRIRVTDFYLKTGHFISKSSHGSITDFRTLAPESILLNKTIPDFNYSFYFPSNAAYSALLGLQFRGKNNHHEANNGKKSTNMSTQLRLGVSYSSALNFIGYSSKEDRKTFDTLTSAQTGEMYFVDSITSNSYSAVYSSNQLQFDGSFIIRTNPQKRWSVYSGIGFLAGFSLVANTSVYYTNSQSIESYNVESYLSKSYHVSFHVESEKHSNKTSSSLSAYIPIGIDFRIGKTNEFWKKIHLFYEAKPCINRTSIPELRTITNLGLFHGIGLRVSWE
jgi:hypothetical protein